MSRKRLLDDHPTMKKLDQIFTLMDELNIHFDIPYERGIDFPFVSDGDCKLVGRFSIKDVDNGEGIICIPPTFDYKLIYDTDETEKYLIKTKDD